jgi:pimeloyl-ACP methyl ester carboxylesterase
MKTIYRLLLTALILATLTPVALALKPSMEYKVRPEKYQIKYEEQSISTPDGATLKAWYFPTDKPRAFEHIIMSHNGEGNMADNLARVTQLTSYGYNVLIYDYRGFGESSAFEIDEAMYVYPEFTTDLQAVIDHVGAKYTGNIHLYGFGIGAGLSFGVGWHHKKVKKIVADAPYTSLAQTKQILAGQGITVKLPDFGYDKKHEPLYALDGNPTTIRGVQIICGGADPGLNEKVYKELQKKNKTLVSIHVIPNVKNDNTFDNNRDQYIKDIVAYLQK